MFLSLKQNLDERIKQFIRPKKDSTAKNQYFSHRKQTQQIMPLNPKVLINSKFSQRTVQQQIMEDKIRQVGDQMLTKKNLNSKQYNNNTTNEENQKMKNLENEINQLKMLMIREEKNNIRKEEHLSEKIKVLELQNKNLKMMEQNSYQQTVDKIRFLEVELENLMVKHKKLQNDYDASIYFIDNLEFEKKKSIVDHSFIESLNESKFMKIQEKEILQQKIKQLEDLEIINKRIQYELQHERAINKTLQLKYKSLKESWQTLISISSQKGEFKRIQQKLEKRCKTLQQETIEKSEKINEIIQIYQNKLKSNEQNENQLLSDVIGEKLVLQEKIQKLEYEMEKRNEQFLIQIKNEMIRNSDLLERKNKQILDIFHENEIFFKEIEEERTHLKQQIATLSEDNDFLKQQNKALRQSINDQKNEKNTLQMKLQVERVENNKLLQKIDHYKQQFKQLENLFEVKEAQSQKIYKQKQMEIQNLSNLIQKSQTKEQQKNYQEISFEISNENTFNHHSFKNNLTEQFSKKSKDSHYDSEAQDLSNSIKELEKQNSITNYSQDAPDLQIFSKIKKNKLRLKEQQNYIYKINELQNIIHQKNCEIDSLSKTLFFRSNELNLLNEYMINVLKSKSTGSLDYDIKISKYPDSKSTNYTHRMNNKNQLELLVNNYKQNEELRNQQYKKIDDKNITSYLNNEIFLIKILINRFNELKYENLNFSNLKERNIMLLEEIYSLKKQIKVSYQNSQIILKQKTQAEELIVKIQQQNTLQIDKIKNEYNLLFKQYEKLLQRERQYYECKLINESTHNEQILISGITTFR